MRPTTGIEERFSISAPRAGDRTLASAPESPARLWISPFASRGTRRSDLFMDLAPLFRSADLPELMRALDE